MEYKFKNVIEEVKVEERIIEKVEMIEKKEEFSISNLKEVIARKNAQIAEIQAEIAVIQKQIDGVKLALNIV